MISLDELKQRVGVDIEKTLDRLVPAADVEPTRLHEAIRWSLFGEGKRIRPLIVFAVGTTFGADAARLSKTAAAIEMVHTYSLIHDDLPAMDDDDLRRGRATCHKQFDEATAILAGDVLQTLAFKAIAEDVSLSGDVRLRLLSALADASGTPAGMVAGQQLDLDAEGNHRSIDQIKQIHTLKTGALISAAAKAGAIIGDASEEYLKAVEQYGIRLGLLFQITDDLLDVTQGTETLGKTAGKDAASEKATYPVLYGIDRSRTMARSIFDEAVQSLSSIDRDITSLEELAEMILCRTK
jgi:geranylgeranyl pyrophosphate synthase